MAKSIISNNPAQLVTKARANLTDFVDDGVINIDATTTAPTKGTVTADSIKYRRVGDSIDVKFEYKQTAAGVSGSGDYLFTLPAGLSFDSNKVDFITTGPSDTSRYGKLYITNDTSKSVNENFGYIVPYDATRFRLLVTIESGTSLLDQTEYMGTSRLALGNAFLTFSGEFSAPIAEWSGSDVTFLAAQPTQRVAYIKEVQPSGTNGGTATAGSYFTRTLNTLEGDTEFVSLSSNQFTLEAGKYEIEAESTGYRVSIHRIKLRNITDSTDDIIGSNAYSDNGGISIDNSRIRGTIEIGASKTYEIQHQVGNTVSTNGLGVACSFGDDEVYTQVKITKLK